MITLSMRRRPMSLLQRREARAGLLFVLPWLISLLLFTVYPIIATVFFSFTDYNIIEAPRWIGLENYQTMLTADPDFWKSVGNSAYYALISVPLGLFFALALALLLNIQARGIGIYRTIFYLPTLVPPVASTLIFMLMFNPNSGGLMNTLLGLMGIQPQPWLSDANQARSVLIILSLWSLGAATLIFLAGLKDVPSTLLEAASIDGAGAWRRFWHVTLPLLSPVLLFNLVMGVISSFQVFTQAMVIGGTTGDPQGSTLMFMVMIYRSAFRYFSMGYASALSVILFLAVLLVTLLIFWSARVWVFYEGGRA
ncbi:carbohydrate ABC transporter permease [Ktedonosporobacter rubrisoli]|uniref:carbohydrate ABC transporter permease n=1 Tax=Ktedonosporobacter rubrisoli TaxID=2509675 RepID=UPI001A935FAB|nr:sugar ABC transporter permease [Ktedonosporobacter rubrisoli]